MAPNPTIRIGVLFVDTAIQLLDLSPIDIFGMFDKTYLSVTPFPAAIKAGAVPMRILYINEAGPNALQECTSRAALRVDASISDEICAPPPTKVMKQKKKNNGEAEKQEKTLDILLIPGPDPEKYKGSAAINGFIRGHFESGTDVLTVCTGILAAGFAGILKGKRVTGPRELVPDFKKKFPEAVWEEKRWTSDGNLWSSAGVTNGQDMVSAYLREKWPGPTAEVVLAMADVGQRGQEYGRGRTANNAWWLWTIVKAWAFPYKK